MHDNASCSLRSWGFTPKATVTALEVYGAEVLQLEETAEKPVWCLQR